MNSSIPDNFYRVSIKALILDETGKKFLIVKEDNGWWEVPGGGLDYGETPSDCLKREIKEEMGLDVSFVSQNPSYFLVGHNMSGVWAVGIVYEVRVKDLNFTPSNECQEIKYVSQEELKDLKAFRTVTELAERLTSGDL